MKPSSVPYTVGNPTVICTQHPSQPREESPEGTLVQGESTAKLSQQRHLYTSIVKKNKANAEWGSSSRTSNESLRIKYQINWRWVDLIFDNIDGIESLRREALLAATIKNGKMKSCILVPRLTVHTVLNANGPLALRTGKIELKMFSRKKK